MIHCPTVKFFVDFMLSYVAAKCCHCLLETAALSYF